MSSLTCSKSARLHCLTWSPTTPGWHHGWMAHDAVWTLRDTSTQMSVPGKILISILQGTVLNREILPKKNRHQLSKKKHPRIWSVDFGKTLREKSRPTFISVGKLHINQLQILIQFLELDQHDFQKVHAQPYLACCPETWRRSDMPSITILLKKQA